ncbi:hypothetical protein [Microcystis sp. M061S2]|uniref:hypothetical protein n=1 Tax=Microcystis sp. M061S2 TaxID=2771171 RepID=UPI002588D6AE|nr:hypothetical protein [Microcystis sp. M061S2]MCA2655950.1 hypothetical protein [Microcystis sp. M061S2]
MNYAHFKARVRTVEEGKEGLLTGLLTIQYLNGTEANGAVAGAVTLPYETSGRAAETIRDRCAENYLLVEGALRVEPPTTDAPNHSVSLKIFSAAPMEPLPVKAVAMAA